jgi:high-affinity iron transporter
MCKDSLTKQSKRKRLVLANFLIGLREGLEAGLVVGILIAYLRKIGRSDAISRLWVGIGAAIVVALATGALLTWGPFALPDTAEEILAGSLSILAVALVTWMVLWMARNARDLRGNLHGKLDAAMTGAGLGIAFVGFLTVGREGVETALFVWASVLASGTAVLSTIGAFLGIFAAVALSYLISRGFVRINLSMFFTWTGLFLILIAAGVLASGIGDLQSAGVLAGAGNVAFNVTAAVPESSWYGTLLAGLFNFNPEPTWLQLGVWLTYIVVVTTLFVRQSGLMARRSVVVSVPEAAPTTNSEAQRPLTAAPLKV